MQRVSSFAGEGAGQAKKIDLLDFLPESGGAGSRR
jgi:hypothetical protein